jgi:hypothetical protein
MVADGRSLGRASISQDLDPVENLGGRPNEFEDRWNAASPSSLRLGPLDTEFATDSDETNLQAEIGRIDANEPQITMHVPIDPSGQIRAVAVRWRLPVPGETMADLDRHNAVLISLVESTAASESPAGVTDCVLQGFGSFSAEEAFVGVDRRVLLANERISYRLLEVDSVVWFTASRSGS